MTRPALLLIAFSFPGLYAADLPGDYRGLSFGADTTAVGRAFPSSENQRFSVGRGGAAAGPGVEVVRVVFRKGPVDSAWLYFTDNRFAMAVEYYFPGEEYYRKAVSQLGARFGQFVGSGFSFFKRQKDRVVHIGYRKKAGMAVVTWMDERLSEEIRKGAADSALFIIDRQIEQVKQSLDSLEKNGKNPAGKKD